MQASPYTSQSSFHKKVNDSTLTKRHVGESYFLAVHNGNIRGAHALILRSCWREEMPLMALQHSLGYFYLILGNVNVLITFGTTYVIL
jgi:hypothetical protein